MKPFVLVLVLVSSLAAFGQARVGGIGGNTGDKRVDPGSVYDRPEELGRVAQAQQPLKPKDMQSGSFKKLQEITGLKPEQLKMMYTASGAKEYKEFATSIMAAKSLGLDIQKVLDGLKKDSLNGTLKKLGVEKDKIKPEIKKAEQEFKDTNKAG